MKKLLVFIAGLFLFGGIMAQDSVVQRLTVNGEIVEKVVTRITFEGDSVVLAFYDTSSQRADMEQVKIVFENSTGINGLSAYAVKSPVDEKIDLANIPADADIVIFDAGGKKLLATKKHTLDVKGLKPGVYVLKVANQIVKFVKR